MRVRRRWRVRRCIHAIRTCGAPPSTNPVSALTPWTGPRRSAWGAIVGPRRCHDPNEWHPSTTDNMHRSQSRTGLHSRVPVVAKAQLRFGARSATSARHVRHSGTRRASTQNNVLGVDASRARSAHPRCLAAPAVRAARGSLRLSVLCCSARLQRPSVRVDSSSFLPDAVDSYRHCYVHVFGRGRLDTVVG